MDSRDFPAFIQDIRMLSRVELASVECAWNISRVFGLFFDKHHWIIFLGVVGAKRCPLGAWPLTDLRPQIIFLHSNLRINLKRHLIQIAFFDPLSLTEQPRVVFRQPMFSIQYFRALRDLSLAHHMVQSLEPLILSPYFSSSPTRAHLLALDPLALSSLPDPSDLGIYD